MRSVIFSLAVLRELATLVSCKAGCTCRERVSLDRAIYHNITASRTKRIQLVVAAIRI
jgi:hypothetical protein